MNEPQPIIDDRDASPFARALLGAGRARRAPEDARGRVWSAVAAGIAAGTISTPATAAAKAGTVAAVGKVKLLLGAVLALGVGASLIVVLAAPSASSAIRSAPQPVATTPPPLSVEPVVPTPAESIILTPASLPDALPRGTQPVLRRKPPAVDSMREEAALLHEARAALSRGDATSAASKINDARRRFPNSQLAPERDALEVRVANDSGDRARAASLARAFVARYPDSPLRSGMESIAASPPNGD